MVPRRPSTQPDLRRMEFVSTFHEAHCANVDTLLTLTECLISLRETCERCPRRRHAYIKLYEGTCDPSVNFGMLTINHTEDDSSQQFLLTIPPDDSTMRSIVNHVFREWTHLESFLGEQNGWIFTS
jgi:hypothetical protein